MKFDKLTKILALCGIVFTISANAAPNFWATTSGNSIVIHAGNNSGSTYSCAVKFNWTYLEPAGYAPSCSLSYPTSSYYITTIILNGYCYDKKRGSTDSSRTFNVKPYQTDQQEYFSPGAFHSPALEGVINQSCSLVDTRASQSVSSFSATKSSIKVGESTTAQATASGGSTNSITISSLTPTVCLASSTSTSPSLSVSNISGISGGTCKLAANKKGDSKYKDAPQVFASITVNKLLQALTFKSQTTVVAGNTLKLSATSSSGLPVQFSNFTNSVCTVTDGVMKGLSNGICTVTALQAGNGTYSPITQNFTVKVIDMGAIMPAIDLLLDK